MWAIEYGYKPLKGSSPEGELPELKKIAARSGEPGLAFASDENTRGIDPDPHIGPSFPDRPYTCAVELELPGQLHLDRPRMAKSACTLTHFVRIIGTQSECRQQWSRRVDTR